MPLTYSRKSSLGRKIQAWAEARLIEAGVTETILHAGSGEEIPPGRYVFVAAESPSQHPDFQGFPVAFSPVVTELTIALAQPSVSKADNTPAALDLFDQAGRELGDVFRNAAINRDLDALLHVNYIGFVGDGSDHSGLDDLGRKLHVFASRFYIDFCEIPE